MRNSIEMAYNHLSNDKVMSFLIRKFKNKIDWENRYNSNFALSIANLIIEQQISFKAAITIKKRFSKIIEGKSKSEIINLSNSKIQSVGISFRKAEYIKNVFNFFYIERKTIDFDKMSSFFALSIVTPPSTSINALELCLFINSLTALHLLYVSSIKF